MYFLISIQGDQVLENFRAGPEKLCVARKSGIILQIPDFFF